MPSKVLQVQPSGCGGCASLQSALDETNGRVSELLRRIDDQDRRIDDQDRRIEELEGEMAGILAGNEGGEAAETKRPYGRPRRYPSPEPSPPKRGRGRPRNDAETTHPRGRPRKHPSPEPPTRPRGRPRKDALMQKRPRGRPRKKDADADADEATAADDDNAPLATLAASAPPPLSPDTPKRPRGRPPKRARVRPRKDTLQDEDRPPAKKRGSPRRDLADNTDGEPMLPEKRGHPPRNAEGNGAAAAPAPVQVVPVAQKLSATRGGERLLQISAHDRRIAELERERENFIRERKMSELTEEQREEAHRMYLEIRREREQLQRKQKRQEEPEANGIPYVAAAVKEPEKKGGKWTSMFESLLAFKKEHGHCNVPQRKNNIQPGSLGQWVKKQRQQHRKHSSQKRSQLTKDRIKKLEGIGFVWDVPTANWDEMFSALKTHYENNKLGSYAQVPLSVDSRLHHWVQNQRKEYKFHRDGKKSAMTEEKISRLQSIEFQFAIYQKNNERETETVVCPAKKRRKQRS